MATITSNGPSNAKLLKDQITLLGKLSLDDNAKDLNTKMDELIEAVKEITQR